MLYIKLFLYKIQEDKRYGTNIENKTFPFSAPYFTKNKNPPPTIRLKSKFFNISIHFQFD